MNSPHLFLFDECYKGRPLNFNWLAGPVIIVIIIINNIIVTIIIITRQGLDGIAGRRKLTFGHNESSHTLRYCIHTNISGQHQQDIMIIIVISLPVIQGDNKVEEV